MKTEEKEKKRRIACLCCCILPGVARVGGGWGGVVND